jgi:hypothetical protein
MRKYLFIFYLLLIGNTVFAQVEVGVKGGYHVSQVLFEPNIGLNLDFLPGMQTGAVIKVSANRNVALLAELNFSQKGWTENFRRANDPENIFFLERTQTFRYNYLELPILTHIYVGGKRVNVFINLGPHFSFLIGADSTSSAEKLEDDVATFSYSSNTAVNFEYGVTAGAGIAVTVGKGTFQLEARLNQGLNNIINRDSQNAPTASLNQLAGISLTYLFRIKQRNNNDIPPESN